MLLAHGMVQVRLNPENALYFKVLLIDAFVKDWIRISYEEVIIAQPSPGLLLQYGLATISPIRNVRVSIHGMIPSTFSLVDSLLRYYVQ